MSTGSATLLNVKELELPNGCCIVVTHGMLALYLRGRAIWKSSIARIGPIDVDKISVEGDRVDLLRNNTILLSRSLKNGLPC